MKRLSIDETGEVQETANRGLSDDKVASCIECKKHPRNLGLAIGAFCPSRTDNGEELGSRWQIDTFCYYANMRDSTACYQMAALSNFYERLRSVGGHVSDNTSCR